jgi:hypothetical protein
VFAGVPCGKLPIVPVSAADIKLIGKIVAHGSKISVIGIYLTGPFVKYKFVMISFGLVISNNIVLGVVQSRLVAVAGGLGAKDIGGTVDNLWNVTTAFVKSPGDGTPATP